MSKIAFMGAGSTIFVKNIIGDSMLSEPLRDSHIALYDIDATRLRESKMMLENLNANINKGRAKISAHLGVGSRKAAFKDASYVVNAIQVGGYEPGTVIDFEIPKKYGLRQTIADTLGIGGIFRGLRTIPVMLDFAHDMEALCPNAWMLNYTNPMAMVTGGVLRGSSAKAVGLCHSVQGCAEYLLYKLGMLGGVKKMNWKVSGINHMAWLLEVKDGGKDLYPEVRRRSAHAVKVLLKAGADSSPEKLRKLKAEPWVVEKVQHLANDLVRLEIMRHFGFYVTESSEHNAEYTPYWIKSQYPELIQKFNIPLDLYIQRCINQIEGWKKQSKEIVGNKTLGHARTHEYGSYIMEAIETDIPYRIHGNVMNTGLITNLPAKAVVEVPCMVDRNGVQGCHVGELPEQLAGLNRTNVNVQILTIEAVLEGSREKLYHAAYLDPHTSAELPLDKIRSLCDDLIKAHGDMLPKLS
ncbi:MAG: alpha-glucosidase/alpha-galactosidase [Lentisphaerae bacterium GWF2_52_8]|nr:MAG: alpha-glucosidase/alpha-galactosidase [Lentisphaerae bacterium GWF2_52_8]